jgi:hypothetical protein
MANFGKKFPKLSEWQIVHRVKNKIPSNTWSQKPLSSHLDVAITYEGIEYQSITRAAKILRKKFPFLPLRTLRGRIKKNVPSNTWNNYEKVPTVRNGKTCYYYFLLEKKTCGNCFKQFNGTIINKYCPDCRQNWPKDTGSAKSRYKQMMYEKDKHLICENSDGHLGFDCLVSGKRCHDTCQLDVHHKDGDNKNDNSDNLEQLCRLCHQMLNLKNYQKVPGTRSA